MKRQNSIKERWIIWLCSMNFYLVICDCDDWTYYFSSSILRISLRYQTSLIHCWFIIYWSLSLVLHSIAIVGDITPSDGVPKAEKSRREQEALNKMCELLGGGMRGFINYFSWIFLQILNLASNLLKVTFVLLQLKRLKNFGKSMKTILL